MRKVALITGGSSGIGLAIAERLIENFEVVIASSDESKLSSAHEHLCGIGDRKWISTYQMNVQSRESVERAVTAIVEKLERIDVLVNCAGIGGGGNTIEFTEEQWTRIIDTNLTGVYRVTNAVLRLSGMIDRKWGRIINIASTGGKQGVMFASAYSASKHGVVGFTKSLGLELARQGITVNAICPGFVETPLAERARQGYAKVWNCSLSDAKSKIEERIPLGRYVVPHEVAGLAAYLASEDSNAILAQALNVCGGLGNY